LYGRFDTQTVIPINDSPGAEASNTETNTSIARAGLTLLSPANFDNLREPEAGDQFVIFTDARRIRQCSNCPEQFVIAPDALQSAILRTFGPEGSEQVSLANISSFTYRQLADYVQFGQSETEPLQEGESTPVPNPVGVALARADWIVFVAIDGDTSSQASPSDVVQIFLADPPVSPDTHLVVLAMGSPYYLDSTEISKLSAYFALYGTGPAYVDTAARALFLQLVPSGDSPVSVPALGYDIADVTLPDPSQTIRLSVAIQQNVNEPSEATATPQDAGPAGTSPLVEPGDTLFVSTEVIVDQNGHHVPDGTPVDFLINYVEEGVRNTVTVTTLKGIATTEVFIDRSGRLQITAVSPPAFASTNVNVDGEIVISTPEPVSPTSTVTVLPEEGLEATSSPPAVPVQTLQEPIVTLGDFVVSLLALSAVATIIFLSALIDNDVNHALLMALPALIGGLIGYNYFALVLPGAGIWRDLLGKQWAAGSASVAGAILGMVIVQASRYIREHGWPRLRAEHESGEEGHES
jgi:beta-N-acetylhexosaminidase